MSVVELIPKQALELSLRLRQHAAYWLLLEFADAHFGPQCQTLEFDLEVADFDGVPYLRCAWVEGFDLSGQLITPLDEDELEAALNAVPLVESTWKRSQVSPPLPEYLFIHPE